MWGDSVQACQLLNEIKQQAHKSTIGSSSFNIAILRAQLGETDLSFQWLV
jgi:hypothetical protein